MAPLKKNDVAGILVAKNEADYYVGLLIYTFQQIKDYKIENSTNGKKNQITNIFVVENLIASNDAVEQLFGLQGEDALLCQIEQKLQGQLFFKL